MIVNLNDITQDTNKVLEDYSNKTVKFRRLDRIMEEAVSTFHSGVASEQPNGGPQKNGPQKNIKTLPEGQTRNMGHTKPPRYRKELKSRP